MLTLKQDHKAFAEEYCHGLQNLQLNNCLVAQQLKNMVFIVQGNLGFISAKVAHVSKVRSFPKKDNQSAEKSTWNIFSLKCEVYR